jgi:hypothetical protein
MIAVVAAVVPGPLLMACRGLLAAQSLLLMAHRGLLRSVAG